MGDDVEMVLRGGNVFFNDLLVDRGAGRATLRRETPCTLGTDELRELARVRMAAERLRQALQPTALAHKASARLAGDRRLPWQNRRHFFAAAAVAMRRVLLDHANGPTARGVAVDAAPATVKRR